MGVCAAVTLPPLAPSTGGVRGGGRVSVVAWSVGLTRLTPNQTRMILQAPPGVDIYPQ